MNPLINIDMEKEFKRDYCRKTFPEAQRKTRRIRRNRQDVQISVCSDQCGSYAQMSAEG